MTETNTDGLQWKAHARIDKFSAQQEKFAIDMGHHEGLLIHDATGRVTNLGAMMKLFTGRPEFGTVEVPGNLLTTVGLNLITNLIIGGTTAGSFKNAQAIVGVGSVSTAANVADTVLGGDGSSSTAWYQQADSSNPTHSNGLITCVATFSTANANFAWNEWCFATTTAGAITGGATLAGVSSGTETMLNHKIASLGTKTSAASWAFTGTVTLS